MRQKQSCIQAIGEWVGGGGVGDLHASLLYLCSTFVDHLRALSPPLSLSLPRIELQLFMKSNALIQAPILKLLSQLLDLNVTYSILDSKSVIFEQILNNLDLIESGIDR